MQKCARLSLMLVMRRYTVWEIEVLQLVLCCWRLAFMLHQVGWYPNLSVVARVFEDINLQKLSLVRLILKGQRL